MVVVYELLDEDGQLIREGAWFCSSSAVPMPFMPVSTGWTVDVELEAFDLSGNRATAGTSEMIACDGCSGSLSGNPVEAPGRARCAVGRPGRGWGRRSFPIAQAPASPMFQFKSLIAGRNRA